MSSKKELKEFNWEEDTWDVIDAYFRDPKALIKSHIDSYNVFVRDIPDIVSQFPLRFNFNFDKNLGRYTQIYIIKLTNMKMLRPTIRENNGVEKPMYPADARLRNLMYAAPIYFDLDQYLIDRTGDEEKMTKLKTHTGFRLGKIPIMLQSQYCILSEQTEKTRVEMGESEYDEGGYFIINGTERVLIAQEKKCPNKTYIFPQTRTTNKYERVIEIDSLIPNKSGYIKQNLVQLMNKQNTGVKLKVRISSKFKNDMPLFVVFRALGVLSDKAIMEFIMYDIHNDANAELIPLLDQSMKEAADIATKEDALEFLFKYIPKVSLQSNDMEYKYRYTENMLLDDFLPHVGRDPIKKAYFLGLMTNKLLQNHLGHVPYDDRDSFINKRIETSGELMANLFRTSFQKLVKDIKTSIGKEIKNSSIEEVINELPKFIKTTSFDQALKYAMSTGNWGQKGLWSKTGVSQLLPRITYPNTLSTKRRIVSPNTNKDTKQPDPRKQHATGIMYIDPCETPEGHKVGIVKNMALSSYITSQTNDMPVRTYLEELGVVALNQVVPLDVQKYVKVFVNGDWMGISQEPTVLMERLRELRRTGALDKYISIAWQIQNSEIRINTDQGRLTRPLYIVEDNVIQIDGATVVKLRERQLVWDELEGIEWVDVEEEDTCMIAMTQDNLSNNNRDADTYLTYTHAELHPALMFGVISCNIPFPNHNQAPRNLYQAAMGKQGMGVYATNFQSRMDTLVHVLDYQQKPAITTRTAKYVNSDTVASGQQAVVAVACYSGYNQEDSLIVNQSSLDRGLFKSTFYRTIRDEEKKNQSTIEEEKFMKPEQFYPDGTLKTAGMKSGNYDKLEESGFVKVGSRIGKDDVIIGKVVPMKGVAENEPKYKDSSTMIRSNEEGVVDWVYSNRKTGEGFRYVKVRNRSVRKPEIGDKFASRHGQKGTIGITYRQEDMPISASGIVPDIVMNPFAFPKRMTNSHAIETVFGKLCALLGCEGDATPFNGTDINQIAEALGTMGFQSSGKEVFYCGMTGRMIEADIFVGPIFYYRLRHLVKDKTHARSTGPYQLMTRQPTEGRARDGGLRVGEMERDAMLAHGAVQFLRERLFDVSDKFVVWICKNCGEIAVANPNEDLYECTYCHGDAEFAKTQLPYATKQAIQEIKSMGISVKLFTGTGH